jgi:hypothetical protein
MGIAAIARTTTWNNLDVAHQLAMSRGTDAARHHIHAYIITRAHEKLGQGTGGQVTSLGQLRDSDWIDRLPQDHIPPMFLKDHNDPLIRDVANGVVQWPRGPDAGIFTWVVTTAIHENQPWRLSDAVNVARDRGWFNCQED